MTTITKLKDAAEALNTAFFNDPDNEDRYFFDALQGLRSVIAEMEAGEPVAHVYTDSKGWKQASFAGPHDLYESLPCYTHPQPKAERNLQMSDAMRDFITGMSVSVDVSTGEDDAYHRYFGVVDIVQDDVSDKHGVTLLVQNATPNFEVQPKADPYDDLVGALAEVRDIFPIPEHGSPIEREWASAMADPCCVPDYVRACIAQPKAEPVVKIQMNFCTCWDETAKRYCARKGTCTTAIAAQFAQPKAEP